MVKMFEMLIPLDMSEEDKDTIRLLAAEATRGNLFAVMVIKLWALQNRIEIKEWEVSEN